MIKTAENCTNLLDSYKKEDSKYERACTLYCDEIAKKPSKRNWLKVEQKIKVLLTEEIN